MNPLVDYEAIVVGGGPAGSAAAITLARAGRDVLLLDRAAFPRDKPCGDLIGARAMFAARKLGIDEADLAPYTPLHGAYVAADAGEIDLTPRSKFGRAVLGRTDARVIPRAIFDSAMVRAAQRSGAELRQLNVRTVGPWTGDGRDVTGQGPDGDVTLRAKAVVIAGGYGCRVASDIASERSGNDGPPRGIAMRGYFANVESPPNRIAFCLNEWVLPGYGWVFPLPDGGANVGVGTLTDGAGPGSGEHLHTLYDRFVNDPVSPAAAWLGNATPEGWPRAWPLDLGPRPCTLVADGLLVAGESSSLVGPLTGAGIAFALESGTHAAMILANRLATGDVQASLLEPYSRFVHRRCLPWLRAEGFAQRWLSDPQHLRRLLSTVRPLPPTATVGARILLHLG